MENTNKKLTKKQIDLFAKMYIGCMALFTEVGLDDAYDQLHEDDVQKLCDAVSEKAVNILGKHEAFSSVKDIIKYIKS